MNNTSPLHQQFIRPKSPSSMFRFVLALAFLTSFDVTSVFAALMMNRECTSNGNYCYRSDVCAYVLNFQSSENCSCPEVEQLVTAVHEVAANVELLGHRIDLTEDQKETIVFQQESHGNIIDQLNETLKADREAMKELERRVDTLPNDATVADALGSIQDSVDDLELRFMRQRASLEGRDANLTKCLGEVTYANRQISNLRYEVAMRDAQMTGKNRQISNLRHGLTAKNAQIASLQGQVTTLRQLAVYPNVAVGKPAYQSSLYTRSTPAGAGNAVDGNRNSYWSGLSCTLTEHQYNQWWRVDLLNTYIVDEVVVTNRRDCCAERLVGAVVRFGSSSYLMSNSKCGSTVTSYQTARWTTIRFVCSPHTRGRYVSVQLEGQNNYLTLCEVEVHGYLA
ncbi:uncharacterized protein [Ptychodera flava]|uniref:uncharacterized protein n=1 Tax=Ptychodera flava TaxID=63121 RepID=UPI003969D976